MNEMEGIIFQLITNSGSARSHVFEALEYARKNDFDKATECLEAAGNELVDAHQVQTNLIQQEASGQSVQVSLLMVHAQDHLMTSILAKDLIEQMVEMQKQIYQISTSK
ncbi:PTS system cellobiose-specific IIA component [Anaerosolibacter carboniphilus]|uniref:PTS system cellobiose-specific IIA component n=1 Tax=Anaerosolibacter carboniphilus TaxID=1417629 RepID=A0A841L6G0_9FIRM|nr:PTS lactose/cellobiose transporter subunit IIA [Anaerosolibacter carboniphilus]MBB6217875.1 PTS system cellobiose-specific IIA component [Anaerosolibacter carboniphilus]